MTAKEEEEREESREGREARKRFLFLFIGFSLKRNELYTLEPWVGNLSSLFLHFYHSPTVINLGFFLILSSALHPSSLLLLSLFKFPRLKIPLVKNDRSKGSIERKKVIFFGWGKKEVQVFALDYFTLTLLFTCFGSCQWQNEQDHHEPIKDRRGFGAKNPKSGKHPLNENEPPPPSRHSFESANGLPANESHA